MKKNKQHDWTDALRDRLQDARLPLEDGWAAGVDPEIPGKGGISWPTAALWPWALAGVAAVLAAVLLLRPAKTPAPGLLVQEVPATTVPASDPTHAANSAPAAASDPAPAAADASAPASTVTPADASAASSPAPSSKTPVFNNGTGKTATPSSKRAISDNGNGNPATPSSKQAVSDNGEEGTANLSPDQAASSARGGNDAVETGRTDASTAQASTDLSAGGPGTLAEAALQDLPDEPDRQKKARRGPVGLRLQASTPGLTLAMGAKSPGGGVPQNDPQYGTSSNGSGTGISSGTGSGTIPGSDVIQQNPGQPQPPALFNNVPQRTPAFPISVGVSAVLPLSPHWSLAAGLDYSQRSGIATILKESSVTSSTVTLHYLGLPVDAHFYFNPDSRLRIYLGAGLKAEKCIHVAGSEPLRDPVLFSGNLQAGADLRILPGIRLYLAPAYTLYFNRSAYSATWIDRPQFSLRAGLTFDLK